MNFCVRRYKNKAPPQKNVLKVSLPSVYNHQLLLNLRVTCRLVYSNRKKRQVNPCNSKGTQKRVKEKKKKKWATKKKKEKKRRSQLGFPANVLCLATSLDLRNCKCVSNSLACSLTETIPVIAELTLIVATHGISAKVLNPLVQMSFFLFDNITLTIITVIRYRHRFLKIAYSPWADK